MNMSWTLIVSSPGSQCETPADDSLGLAFRLRVVTHKYHLSEELASSSIDRCSRPGGIDSRKRFTVILETTTPRLFKRDWMVERLSPLARMFMIGSSYGNSTDRFHCGLDLIDFGTPSSWRPLPPLRNRCFDNAYSSFRKKGENPRDLRLISRFVCKVETS